MKMIADCVREKDRIQAELKKEYFGLSLEQQSMKMEQEILANPVLSDWYSRMLHKIDNAVQLKVAEEPGEYKTGE